MILYYTIPLSLIYKTIACVFLSIATCEDGAVRLVVGDDAEGFYQGYYSYDYDDTYYDKGQLTRGRVEVCIGGIYGTICFENWDYEDASVICSQLGFYPHGMYRKQLLLLCNEIVCPFLYGVKVQ